MDPIIMKTITTCGTIVGVGSGVVGLFRYLYLILSRFTAMAASLEVIGQDVVLIKTNHLPHLDEKIDKLKDAFTDHLLAEASQNAKREAQG
jgi:hypothetical protein